MIVDDHAGMRRVLKHMLLFAIKEPVEIIECESGEEAVIEYGLNHPDCVLMDFELRKMNGFEATHLIYKEDKNAKIVIVTSYNSPSMKKKAQKLHVQGFVSKDNLSELNEILQSITYK